MRNYELVSREFQVQPWQVEAVMKLVDEGATLPFIARYRKEQHGSIDDQKLREITERVAQLRAIDERRGEIAGTLEKLGVLNDELRAKLDGAATLGALEDIYRPYRPKRRTRASVAKEKGLEPLAAALLLQDPRLKDAEAEASAYISEEKGVASAEEALQGAMDILAEMVSDDADVRTEVKDHERTFGQMHTVLAEGANDVYAMYADKREPYRSIPSHRVLAIDRGEREGSIKVSLEANDETAVRMIERRYVRDNGSAASAYVASACEDAFKRLIAPSVVNEMRHDLTERAQKDAIRVFATNLRSLLMQPPVRGKVAIGLDPGIYHGCKIAVVDETGRVLDTAVIYPLEQQGRVRQAKDTVLRLIRKDGVQVAAIGNGTASRETEQFFVQVMQELRPDEEMGYMVVSEAGASVYSASKLAAEEFPQFDVNLRSAVSIARRLQDPLAELIKIDPKAIGVGQYQHDLDQKALDAALDGVVEDCVNAVGVELNTASVQLLSHVAGINAAVAKNIVAYREENGGFRSRSELKKVPRLGPKAFEQCAGFLRIADGKEPLDATAVHPESYAAARALLKRFGLTAAQARNGSLREAAAGVGLKALSEELGVGEPTLRDMLAELEKPGRDPRDSLPPPVLRHDVLTMDDLVPGMELRGTVRNVTDFGAFVDIGVHRDGLVHVSQLPGPRGRVPSDVLRVGDVVTVWLLDVNKERQRISLTMRKPRE